VVHVALSLNTVEGGVLALLVGLVQDATTGHATGLSAFACVALFVALRLALSGLRADGRFFEALLAVGAVGFWHLMTTFARVLLGGGGVMLATPWLGPVAWSSLATVLASPFVLRLLSQVERLPKRSGKSSGRV
jgi:cell shape-determining protein MreD